MQPATLPLEIYRGDSFRARIKLFSPPVDVPPGTPTNTPPGEPVPIDLTGVIAKSEIRDRPAGTTVIPFTCTITLPNIIDLFLPADKSQKLPQNGVWDLQLNYGSGDVHTPLAGPVKVTADVTDSTLTPTLLP